MHSRAQDQQLVDREHERDRSEEDFYTAGGCRCSRCTLAFCNPMFRKPEELRPVDDTARSVCCRTRNGERHFARATARHSAEPRVMAALLGRVAQAPAPRGFARGSCSPRPPPPRGRALAVGGVVVSPTLPTLGLACPAPPRGALCVGPSAVERATCWPTRAWRRRRWQRRRVVAQCLARA